MSCCPPAEDSAAQESRLLRTLDQAAPAIIANLETFNARELEILRGLEIGGRNRKGVITMIDTAVKQAVSREREAAASAKVDDGN